MKQKLNLFYFYKLNANLCFRLLFASVIPSITLVCYCPVFDRIMNNLLDHYMSINENIHYMCIF